MSVDQNYLNNNYSGKQDGDTNFGKFKNDISTGLDFVPRHIHDGTDSPKITYADINPGSVNTVEILVTPDTIQGNTFTVNGVSNPKQVTFAGIARSPISGTVTAKASLYGTAYIGKSYQITGLSSATTPTTSKQQTIQTSICNFFTRSSVTGGYSWLPYVNADNLNLASIIDDSGNQIGSIQLISYTSSSVTLQAPLNSGWEIIGFLTII